MRGGATASMNAAILARSMKAASAREPKGRSWPRSGALAPFQSPGALASTPCGAEGAGRSCCLRQPYRVMPLGLYVDSVTITSKTARSEEHTSELQSLMRISYAVFCLKKKNTKTKHTTDKPIARNTKKPH